ncbi:hypothetical protein BDN72DRAFT_259983 [Pluteus cervinus]|uniref:Uncharacterized protein n=1 Tax=Pluteus cervinus TaxID=181527 RepID=A0ACD3B5Z7_9AGAR|nr:hypothetical protein BDN72DRAFT_259983 [Pluteus cervinus]
MASQLLSINDFPPDLLSEIFLWMAEATSDRKYMKSVRIARSLITSVCSHWRSVGLELAPFWAVIQATMLNADDDIQNAIEMTEILLERSKGCLLMIILESSINCTPLLDILLAHVERWRLIRLNLPSTLHRYLLCAQGKLHRLQKIRLQGNEHIITSDPENGEQVEGLPSPYGLYENVPNLHTVDVSTFPFSIESIPLPWAQLKAFSASVTTEEVQRISELAPALEDWRIAEKGAFVPATVIRRSLPPLLRLTNLFIRSNSFLGFDLSYLPPLPALESLSLENRSNSSTLHWLENETFHELIRKISPHARAFTYHGVENCLVLPSALGTVQNLTKLSVRSSYRYPAGGVARFFHTLTFSDPASSGGCLLPKLEDILFQFKGGLPEKEVMTMIISRCFTDAEGKRIPSVLGVSCLRSVDLIFAARQKNHAAYIYSSLVSTHCAARMAVLRSQGLRIAIQNGPQKISEEFLSLPDTLEGVDGVFLEDSFFSSPYLSPSH